MSTRFKKQNCSSSVRDLFTDKWGRTIIVTGTYAYEWSVTIKSSTSVTTMRFRTRIEAVKLITELKRRR
jgi:hypothetical protein